MRVMCANIILVASSIQHHAVRSDSYELVVVESVNVNDPFIGVVHKITSNPLPEIGFVVIESEGAVDSHWGNNSKTSPICHPDTPKDG